jgi:septal ring factor EnvC (AmiA/AmiB activator)
MTHNNPPPELQDLQDLVSQIVHLREQMRCVEADKQRAQEQVNAHAAQLKDLKAQMRDVRKLLDHCLDTGEDVTAVKLTKTVSELGPTKAILIEDYFDTFNNNNRQYLDAFSKKSINKTF